MLLCDGQKSALTAASEMLCTAFLSNWPEGTSDGNAYGICIHIGILSASFARQYNLDGSCSLPQASGLLTSQGGSGCEPVATHMSTIFRYPTL